MARDLSDPWAEIRALKERVRILETATPLQDASVTRGRLRVASADGFVAEAVPGGAPAVRVTGLQVVDGVLRVTGTLEGGGTWSWSGTLTQTGTTNLNGPWNLNGVGTIAGDVTATGTLTQNGPWNLVGLGTITGDVTQTGNTTQQGNVTLTGGGKITVAGSDPIVIAQESGQAKIKVGSVGMIAGSDSGIQMAVEGDPNRRVVVTPSAIRLVGVTNAAADASPDFWLGIQHDGTLRRYSAGSGGPMGGDFDWPFSLSMVTSEYGMRVHPITGIETMHYGIDFGAPNGANIPAASRGTVLTVGSDSGRGNYVVLSHANNVETHYFHLLSPSPLSSGKPVAKGATLGQVGSTGSSTAPHLHFEVHVNGSPINPRDFAGLD